MMRPHALIPNRQTQTIVKRLTQCAEVLFIQSAKAQSRFYGFEESHGCGFVPLWESTNADFRKSTKAANRKQ